MANLATSKTRYLWCALCAVAACSTTVLICMSAQADAADFIDGDRAQIGEDGKIYGVPFEGPDGNVIIPDMTRVLATNGKYGYISTEEMHAAIIDYAISEEERIQSIRNTASMRAPAIASATEEYFGTSFLTPEELEECAKVLINENGYENALNAYSEIAAEPLAAAINQGKLEREKAIDLVRISAENAVVAMASEEALSHEDMVEAQAATLVDNCAVNPITSDQITITRATFDVVYQLAQEKLAVSIPVYSSDGTTVVGSYLVDRM